MFKITIFFLGVILAIFCLANNGLQSYKIIFSIGVAKLTESVIKQASDIYNKLPEQNFTRINFIGIGEEKQAKLV
tara:strand:- start:404 stop:628 length:225 start_codon:yes stop_codon:yes gene_type:complete